MTFHQHVNILVETIKRGRLHDGLKLIVLYPCSKMCGRWTVTEWCEDDHKVDACVVDGLEQAKDIYRGLLGHIVESIYDPKTDKYSFYGEANVIVQGSHGICAFCEKRTAREGLTNV